MKKILVILDTEPEWGGAHQYATALMECLLEKKENVEIAAICATLYWKRWCRKNGIRVLETSWYFFTEKEQNYHLKHPLFSRIYCMYISKTGRMLSKEKIDAVLYTAQCVFVPCLGVKTIIPVHDLMHRYEGRFPEVAADYDRRERIFASNAKYAWCVLADSKVGKQQFIESYSKYMGKKLPHVISLPYVVSKSVLEADEEYMELPGKYVCYPAQFWQHKNHLNLIRAVRILRDDIPDVHLVLVGSEKNNMKNMKQYILENGLDKNVTIKGFVSNGNMKYLYTHASGLVMPSYFGPTNIPPLEAMALGCPAAVSNKYAMPEQVGDAGLLFNPDSPEEIAECIKKMWCDDRLRQMMIKKGYCKIRQWTKKEFGKRLQKIIDKV